MRASQNGYHEVVRTLLEGGTDVNDKTNVRNQKMILMMMIVVFNVSINYHDDDDDDDDDDSSINYHDVSDVFCF